MTPKSFWRKKAPTHRNDGAFQVPWFWHHQLPMFVLLVPLIGRAGGVGFHTGSEGGWRNKLSIFQTLPSGVSIVLISSLRDKHDSSKDRTLKSRRKNVYLCHPKLMPYCKFLRVSAYRGVFILHCIISILLQPLVNK